MNTRNPTGRPRRFARALLALGAAFVPAAGGAQTPPGSYGQAIALLAAGDTAAAVAHLREAVRAEPGFGPGHLKLGAVLSATASEVERDFEQRDEARRVLSEAVRLLPSDPEALLEYGLLLRKQHMRVDARRVLDRAWNAAGARGAELAPRARARLHHALGLIYESWWEDWQDLVWLPPTAAQVRCFRAYAGSHADRAVACPEDFARQFEQAVSVADDKSDERERMIEHFRMALEADPGHVGAAVHLLGHLADGGDWNEYVEVAEALVDEAPADPRSHLFLGLGFHERGRTVPALAAFGRALDVMTPSDRATFGDITPLLKRDERALHEARTDFRKERARRAFFTALDPLYLTVGNERELEHYARLAWAELKFSAPASGIRGWDTERGNIWVRYGRPWLRYQCCQGGEGRLDYWSYSELGPVFVFSRSLTYRLARHTEFSREVSDELQATTPQSYQPVAVSEVHELPLQLVRLRGSLPQLTRVEIYGAAPVARLAGGAGAELETGVFVFDQTREELWNSRRLARVVEGQVKLNYGFEVPRGVFHYSVESRLAAPDSAVRPAARARGRLDVGGFLPGRLSLSDILVAHSIREKTQLPGTRADLAIEPSRSLRFRPGRPFNLYFEVYGLDANDGGVGRYRAEVAVEDRNEDGFVSRILSIWAPGVSRGERDETRVSWERTVQLGGDRTMDFLELELPDVEEGDYRIRLRVTDLVTGQTAESARSVTITQTP